MSFLKGWQYGLGCAVLGVALGWPAPVIAAGVRYEASPEVVARLDAIMGKNISHLTPGCVVGIHSTGADLLRAYGQADLERGVSNTPDSVFNVASVSKQVTAAAVLLLASDGKLALNDDVRKYLPELPVWPQPITVDDLLSHTSGLRDFRFTDWMLGRDALPQHNKDVLAYAARQRSLNHPPGESHLYTNTGYVLLPLIVERVSGQSFQEFTRERLFEPAGMVRTQWQDDSRRIVEKRSVGYALVEPAKDGKPAKFEQIPTAQTTFGNGNLLTTVSDMQRWNAALSRNVFGPKLTAQLEELAKLRNGHVFGYARGEYVGKYRGHREVQHSGYNGTYTAWVGRYPEADLSVSLLCNSDGDDVYPRDIVDLFLPSEAPPRDPAEKKAALRTKDLSAYSGVYRRAGSDQLVLWSFPQQGAMEGDLFTRGPASFEFDPRRVGHVVRHSYGNASEWTLLPVWKPALAALGEFQGRFTSDELLGSYDVAFDGKLLTITVSGLSELSASLQARAVDVFEAQGLPQLGGLLVVFRRDKEGRISGLALAPDSLHEIPFRRVETN